MSNKIFLFCGQGYDGFKLSGEITESEIASKLEELKNTPNVLRIMIWESGIVDVAEDWVYSPNNNIGSWSRVARWSDAN